MTSSPKLQRILVATDFSEAAQHAIERVVYLPLENKAQVKIVYVSRDLGGYKNAARIETIMAENLLKQEAYLKKHLRHHNAEVESEIKVGQVSESIIEAAEEMDAELIVMGGRGWKVSHH